jgi:PilZ domain
MEVTVLPAGLGYHAVYWCSTERGKTLVLGQKCLIFALQFTKADASLAHSSLQQPQGVLMADGAERREARRFTMSLPMRVLPREAKGHELEAQTRDVSYRGLYFLTAANFEIGNEIEFVITLPQQVTQSGDVNIRCLGEVVRIEPTENGKVGIAAKIARYEFMPAAATAA